MLTDLDCACTARSLTPEFMALFPPAGGGSDAAGCTAADMPAAAGTSAFMPVAVSASSFWCW